MRIFILLVLVSSTYGYLSLDSYSQEAKKKNSKISSALLYAISEQDSETETTASRSLLSTVRDLDEAGNIRVYIRLNEFSKENLEKLKEEGVVVEIYDESQNLVQGKVPADSIDKISNLSIVKFVDLPNVGFTNAGSVQTEGDAVLNADQTRSTFGVDGAGIKVGVVSNGIDGLTQSIASGDIPAAGIMVPSSPIAEGGVGINDPCPPFTSVTSTPADRDDLTSPPAEGLAMLEIIHDIAPGAELYFANGFPTSLEFQRAKKCLTEVVDIIADDVAFFNAGPYDGTSPASLQSTASVQAGVSNFISVGNYAQLHYQGVFTDTDEDGFHEFDVSLGLPYMNNSGETLDITIPPSAFVRIFLQWNDPFGASSNDYDMFVIQPANPNDPAVVIVSSSENPQDGDDDPIEIIPLLFNDTGVPQTAGIVIFNFNAPNAKEFDLFVTEGLQGLDEFVVMQGSVPNNSDADLVCSVGAVGLGQGDPLGQSPEQIRNYSSRGPTNDGRMKPDLVAPDGVSITGNGGFSVPFFGTSAAAPHAAGVAALLLQADESLTPEAITAALQQSRALSPPQVADVLSNTAVDLGPPGPDNTFGFGRIDAFAAVQSVAQAEPGPTPTPTQAPPASPTPTPTQAPPGNSGGSGGDGGCSIGGNATTSTTLANILMPFLILVGCGLVSRFKRTLK